MVDGTPVEPEVLRTTVDMQSQYSSLYSKLPETQFRTVEYCSAAQLWWAVAHLFLGLCVLQYSVVQRDAA